MKLTNNYPYLSLQTISYINSLIDRREDFDETRFIDWLRVNNIKYKNYPDGYVRSCFEKELNNEKFDKVGQHLSLNQAFQYKLGIQLTNDELLLLDYINCYMLEQDILSLKQLRTLNHNLLEYMSKLPKEKQSASHYITLFQKSRLLKGIDINFDAIIKEHQIEMNELLDNLAQL